jgi:hypothetical protein
MDGRIRRDNCSAHAIDLTIQRGASEPDGDFNSTLACQKHSGYVCEHVLSEDRGSCFSDLPA